MRSMSQTVRLLENVGFNVGDPRGHRALRFCSAFIMTLVCQFFPSVWFEDLGTAKALLNT